MFNNPYMNQFNSQVSIDRINNQISELEKMRNQMQQPTQQPTNLTQNFQLAPTNNHTVRYANTIEDVEKEQVFYDTPFFSKDMSVLWFKSAKGEIKTYELNEIKLKDEKDMKIDFLMAQIEELKKEMKDNESNGNVDESVKDEESSNVQTISKSSKKQK